MLNRTTRLTAIAGVAAMVWSASASAALHAYCNSTFGCVDNGIVTPTTQNPPTFGFSASPGGSTGTYYLDILAPNNLPAAANYMISGAFSGTANLFSTTAWTSGTLGSYLGISASPTNPIGAWLPSTQAVDAGATGYWVYQVNLGTATLPGASTTDGTTGNLTLGSLLPVGGAIVAFLDQGTAGVMATANSGALFEGGNQPPTSVPEPGTLALLAAGLALVLGRKALARRALPMTV